MNLPTLPAPRAPIPSLRARKQSGATLVEILVAVLILSLGMLGMSSLQLRALQGNQSAVQRSQAIMLGQWMLDSMRVDRETARGGTYNTGAGGAFVCGAAGIAGANNLPNDTLRQWLNLMDAALGDANGTTCGSVNCDGNVLCTVQIRWDDSKATGNTNPAVTLQTITLTSVL